MKLSYFEKISPTPFYMKDVGMIRKHTLKEISLITYEVYQIFLSIFLITPYSFYESKKILSDYLDLSLDERSHLSIFNLLLSDRNYRDLMLEAIDFFFIEAPNYNEKNKTIVLQDDQNHISGFINSENWESICDAISQLNNVEKELDSSMVKSKKALKILEKIQKGRKRKAKNNTPNPDLDIGNIVSVLASYTPLNYITIWDITVYQLWDMFERFRISEIYGVKKINTSVWGDKKNQFDIWQRTKLINQS